MFLRLLILFFCVSCVVEGYEWDLHLFSNSSMRNSLCNDGTAGGFYVRQVDSSSPRSNVWIIHLSGGFWCWDEATCQSRWEIPQGKIYMSSNVYPKTLTYSGIFDLSETNNPFFYNANSALGIYCSSDSWSGRSAGDENGTGWNFFGYYNAIAMLEDLWDYYQLGEAELVVISGCSAGGMGQIVNIDRMRDWFHQRNPIIEVRGLVDAGWFLDYPLYPDHGNENSFNTPIIPLRDQIQQGYLLWKGEPDTDCVAFYASENEIWKCYLGEYAYHFLSTENFYHQELYDAWQVSYNFGMDYGSEIPPWNTSQTEYANDFAAAMNTTLHYVLPSSGVYSPECLHHCSLLNSSFWEVKLAENALSLSDTFGSWFYNNSQIEMIDDCSSLDCSLNCPTNGK